AMQALAAVLGGVQSLHTNARDEAWRLPTASSAVLALRTQQILAHECGLADFPDPLGGSHAIEAETDRIEQESLRWMEAVDSAGGALRAVVNGFVQSAVRESAYRDFTAAEQGSKVIVGVNRFASSAAPLRSSRNLSRSKAAIAEETRAAEA